MTLPGMAVLEEQYPPEIQEGIILKGEDAGFCPHPRRRSIQEDDVTMDNDTP